MTGRTGSEHIPFAFLRPPPKALNTAALIRPSMTWGLQNRLGRIIQPDRHAVMLAVDHGYFMGPTSRLEDPRKTITPLLPYTDSIMITRGTLRNCVDARSTVPVVLRVSGGVSILSEDLSKEKVTTSVRDA